MNTPLKNFLINPITLIRSGLVPINYHSSSNVPIASDIPIPSENDFLNFLKTIESSHSGEKNSTQQKEYIVRVEDHNDLLELSALNADFYNDTYGKSRKRRSSDKDIPAVEEANILDSYNIYSDKFKRYLTRIVSKAKKELEGTVTPEEDKMSKLLILIDMALDKTLNDFFDETTTSSPNIEHLLVEFINAKLDVLSKLKSLSEGGNALSRDFVDNHHCGMLINYPSSGYHLSYVDTVECLVAFKKKNIMEFSARDYSHGVEKTQQIISLMIDLISQAKETIKKFMARLNPDELNSSYYSEYAIQAYNKDLADLNESREEYNQFIVNINSPEHFQAKSNTRVESIFREEFGDENIDQLVKLLDVTSRVKYVSLRQILLGEYSFLDRIELNEKTFNGIKKPLEKLSEVQREINFGNYKHLVSQVDTLFNNKGEEELYLLEKEFVRCNITLSLEDLISNISRSRRGLSPLNVDINSAYKNFYDQLDTLTLPNTIKISKEDQKSAIESFGGPEKYEKYWRTNKRILESIPDPIQIVINYYKRNGIEQPENVSLLWKRWSPPFFDNKTRRTTPAGIKIGYQSSLIDATLKNIGRGFFGTWHSKEAIGINGYKLPGKWSHSPQKAFHDIYQLLDAADIQSEFNKKLKIFTNSSLSSGLYSDFVRNTVELKLNQVDLSDSAKRIIADAINVNSNSSGTVIIRPDVNGYPLENILLFRRGGYHVLMSLDFNVKIKEFKSRIEFNKYFSNKKNEKNILSHVSLKDQDTSTALMSPETIGVKLYLEGLQVRAKNHTNESLKHIIHLFKEENILKNNEIIKRDDIYTTIAKNNLYRLESDADTIILSDSEWKTQKALEIICSTFSVGAVFLSSGASLGLFGPLSATSTAILHTISATIDAGASIAGIVDSVWKITNGDTQKERDSGYLGLLIEPFALADFAYHSYRLSHHVAKRRILGKADDSALDLASEIRPLTVEYNGINRQIKYSQAPRLEAGQTTQYQATLLSSGKEIPVRIKKAYNTSEAYVYSTLKTSPDYHSDLFDYMPEVISVTDKNGKIITGLERGINRTEPLFLILRDEVKRIKNTGATICGTLDVKFSDMRLRSTVEERLYNGYMNKSNSYYKFKDIAMNQSGIPFVTHNGGPLIKKQQSMMASDKKITNFLEGADNLVALRAELEEFKDAIKGSDWISYDSSLLFTLYEKGNTKTITSRFIDPAHPVIRQVRYDRLPDLDELTNYYAYMDGKVAMIESTDFLIGRIDKIIISRGLSKSFDFYISNGDLVGSIFGLQDLASKTKFSKIDEIESLSGKIETFVNKFVSDGSDLSLATRSEIQNLWVKNIRIPFKNGVVFNGEILTPALTDNLLSAIPSMTGKMIKSAPDTSLSSLVKSLNDAVDSLPTTPLNRYRKANSKHEYLIPGNGKSIEILGHSEYYTDVTKSLDKMSLVPSGKMLLDEIGEQRVRIQAPTMTAVNRIDENGLFYASNSAGGDVISFDPKNKIVGGDVSAVKTKPWLDRDPSIGLYHELLHAYFTRRPSKFKPLGGGGAIKVGGDMQLIDEFRIVGADYTRVEDNAIFAFGSEAYLKENLREYDHILPLSENRYRAELAKINNEEPQLRPYYGTGII